MFVPPVGPVPVVAVPRSRRRIGRLVAVILVPALAILTFFGGAAADRSGILPGAPVASSPGPAATNADLALIEQAWTDILQNYVAAKDLKQIDLAYGAIRGMTEAVGDEGHTVFLTAEDAKAVDDSLSGTFVGIGVQLGNESDSFVIADVIPDTPAEEAGLQRGDEILAVDGTATKGKPIDEVISRVRGPAGESVTLTIKRAGRAKPFDVKIVRRQFDLPLVTWSMVPGRKIAYIRLEQFATGAADVLKATVSKARAKGATAIVFDLRANPGGYVNEAIGVASQFVGSGTIYQSIDASGKKVEVPASPGGVATDIPIVVLADGDTASSAEIVTGAIQDAKRGKVVGEKTFGTGTVLGRFDLADGSSLRIGVERWLTRNGRPIWHEGLEPDVAVPLPDNAPRLRPNDLVGMSAAQLAKSGDTQLLRALTLLKGDG